MSDENIIISSEKESELPTWLHNILKKRLGLELGGDSLVLYLSNINDEMLIELCGWIAKLVDQLRKLDLGFNEITSYGATNLFDTLRDLSSIIEHVSLAGNKKIDDTCMKSLGEYIKSNMYIKSISLTSSQISDIGIETLVPYLDGNKSMKILNLRGNKYITNKSIPLLVKMAERSKIQEISIQETSATQIDTLELVLVQNAIKNGTETLILDGKSIDDDFIIKLCGYMKSHGIYNLKEIALHRNMITSKGACALFHILRKNRSKIDILHLTSNKLDDDCMESLGMFIQESKDIEKLEIGNNKITDKGVEVLMNYLRGNTSLRKLHLHFNLGITNESVENLLEIIKTTHITQMDIYDSSITFTNQLKLKKALSTPIEEREIPIRSNTKSAAKSSAST